MNLERHGDASTSINPIDVIGKETAALIAANKRATFGIVMATTVHEAYKMGTAERVACFGPREG